MARLALGAINPSQGMLATTNAVQLQMISLSADSCTIAGLRKPQAADSLIRQSHDMSTE